MKRHDRVIRVVLAGEQCLDPDIFKSLLECIQHLLDLRNNLRIIFFVAHLNHQLDLLILIGQLLVGRYVFF